MVKNTDGTEVLSQCCGTSVVEDTKPAFKDHTEVEQIYTCTACKLECDVYDDKNEYHFGDKEEDNRVDEPKELDHD